MDGPTTREEIIDPALPIIDPHHHLWFVPQRDLDAMALEGDDCVAALARIYETCPRYLFDEFLADLNTGHNIRASVYIEVHAMFRAGGPPHLRSVGEVEFANGMAAMAASGTFGETRICAGIIGAVDFSMGDAAAEVLEAHLAAGGGRYRGVRSPGVAYAESLAPLNRVLHSRPHVMAEPQFREGFRHLGKLGLHYEAWLLEPQLADLRDLAIAFPDTQIVLNHLGGPIGFGTYRHDERFPIWRRSMAELAALPNISVKLGGLGNPLLNFPSAAAAESATSAQLAEEWRPHIESCIETFGADRCLFESNYPVDSMAAPYEVIWNAFKRITRGASQDEKHALYFANARRIYRLDV